MNLFDLARYADTAVVADNDGTPFVTLTNKQAQRFPMPENCSAARNLDGTWNVYLEAN